MSELTLGQAILHLELFGHVLYDKWYVSKPNHNEYILWIKLPSGWWTYEVWIKLERVLEILGQNSPHACPAWADAKCPHLRPKPNCWDEFSELAVKIIARDPMAIDLAADIMAKGG